MGNVSAAEGPQGVPSGGDYRGGGGSLGSSPVPKQTSGEPASKDADENPGLYEDLHKQTKDIFPQVFEGAKVIIAKGLSSHFQISHTITLATFTPSVYRFGATYIGTKQLSPSEAFPVLLGDIDSQGNMNANLIHAFSERIRGKLVAQVSTANLISPSNKAVTINKSYLEVLLH
ncbi:hypothetical protein EGW08_020594 [Elysia chlorotica]|uniref:Uncharacterized protein n=1 Tax=Elysia chlorotica TaxID=188477 RepID=A0A433SQX5_ELYCH|nr:hypothetical protein EGW08_020594 [Elysia chlorotica]